MNFRSLLACALVTTAVAFSAPLAAQAAVTVGTPAAGPTGGNCLPFSCNESGDGSGVSITYYQIYSADAFSGPLTFDTIAFQSAINSHSDLIAGTYDISFSTTDQPLDSPYPVGHLSNTETFSQFTTGGSAATGLSLRGASYTYDPSSGDNLVLEVIASNQATVPNDQSNGYLAIDDTGLDLSRAFQVTGSMPISDDLGLVTTFSDVSATPEPATWALMIVGLGAIGAALRFSTLRSRSTRPLKA